MNTTEFYVIPYPKNTNQDLICQDNGEIKLRVLNLKYHPEYYLAKEKHWLGDDHGDPLAFETVGYKTEWPEDKILAAIRWYARYLDYLDMEIRRE